MKLYLHSGRYYERQVDCPNRNFKTVEFNFSASPKSDFVAWFNSINAGNCVDDVIVEDGDESPPPVDRRIAEQAAKPAPAPHEPRPIPTADAVIEYVLNKAGTADVENIFAALGARFHEIRKASV